MIGRRRKKRSDTSRFPPPPRLRRPGADALLTRLVYGRRVPVRHGLLGGLPLLDTRGGVYLVHAVHDIPALRGDAGRFANTPRTDLPRCVLWSFLDSGPIFDRSYAKCIVT